MFSDLTLNTSYSIYRFDNYRLPIEIQESHHHYISDIQRKNEIFANTGEILVLYYIEDDSFLKVYKNIMKSLAKIYIKIDEKNNCPSLFSK